MMKSMKMFAIAAAVMMMAGAMIAIVDTTDDSDATVADNYKVYYYNGINWSSHLETSYDLFQAVVGAQSDLNFSVTADTNTTWTFNTNGTNPNPAYGTISAVNNSTNFTVFVYDDFTNPNLPVWKIAQSALGWYRCYSDYAENVFFPDANWDPLVSAGAANVAICMGTYTTIPAGTTGMIPLTVPGTTSEYTYEFTISDLVGTASVVQSKIVEYYDYDFDVWDTKTLTTSDLSGIKIRGYGSDVFQALINAIGSGNIETQSVTWKYFDRGTTDPTDDYYQYYSWIGKLFNVTTLGPVYGSDAGGNYSLYTYWEFRTANDWPSFSPGYLSQISGALVDDQGSTIYYTYYVSKWYY